MQTRRQTGQNKKRLQIIIICVEKKLNQIFFIS